MIGFVRFLQPHALGSFGFLEEVLDVYLLLWLVLRDIVLAYEPSEESFVFARARYRKAIVAMFLKILQMVPSNKGCTSMLKWLRNSYLALFLQQRMKVKELSRYSFVVFFRQLSPLSLIGDAQKQRSEHSFVKAV